MEQKKVGQFLKTLRKEKNITQEVLAEALNVSGRTVSRWETGRNMPDISLLAELSEFYQVSIPEIIDGDRKSENMNQETKDTAVKMAEYSCVIVLFGIAAVSDYIAVSQFQQVPRFRYETSYGEGIVEHKALFYTVIQKNPGTEEERVEIVK